MPRPSAWDKEEVINVLKAAKHSVVTEHGIAGPTNTVWKQLSDLLRGEMSPKNMYTFVKLNRHNCWETLEIKNEESEEPDCTDTEPEYISDDPDENPHNTDFQMTISYDEWATVWKEEVEYSNTNGQTRQYTILKRGTWTHLLNQNIWESTKSPCTITFKRAKVYPNSLSKPIDITGYCTECNARLSIVSESMPEEGKPVLLQCQIQNVDDNLHTGKRKRRLTGARRKIVSEELCKGKQLPHVWRVTEAHNIMNLGDPEPSHLPNLATLRKAKQEKKSKELGNQDPILSLQVIKHSVPHSGSIHDIGLDNFFCHYWTPSQMHVYKAMSKIPGSTVSFDATGTVVKKLKRPTGTSGHIFLYQGVLSSPGVHIPVVQMLSERHDIQAIQNWLSEWRRAGAAVPKEVVCDFSLALLGGVVKAFTLQPDLKTYIDQCFGVLMGKEYSTLPPCFVRVDVAHCIKIISRWDCLRKKGNRVREFYLRAMAQLLQSVTMDQAKELIRSIVVVALSESEGSDAKGTPVFSRLT